MPVSKYELEIFNNIFSSIAEQMGSVLMRSAFSPNIKERKDFSCAIFNAEGDMIAQAAHIPVHLGSMSFSVDAIREIKEIKEGDVFILNDPFKGGTHLPDITCISPVFIDTKLEFFVATRAHHADIGGKTPGSMPLSTSIHEEGIIIPPSKLFDKGNLNEKLFKKLMESTRDPVEREGDLIAQTSSLDLGKKKIEEIVKRYGLEIIKEASDQLLSYSENIMKKVIEDIPEGSYEFVDFLDDDGAGTENIPIKVKLNIDKDTAVIDFKGSSKKVRGCLNAPLSVTTAATLYVFQCLAPKDMPLNSGPLRTLKIIVDEDSILNAKYPSAVAGGNVETSQRIVDVIFGALSKAIPEKIQAASAGTMSNITFGGINPKTGSKFAYYETIAGGMGARMEKNGVDAVQTHMTNTLNTPIEAIERELPVRVKSYSVRKNSGGSGKYRGGNGVIREFEFLQRAKVTILTERRKNRPYGIKGGKEGSLGKNILHTNKTAVALPPKVSLDVKKGDILRIETPGGGGWGESSVGEPKDKNNVKDMDKAPISHR